MSSELDNPHDLMSLPCLMAGMDHAWRTDEHRPTIAPDRAAVPLGRIAPLLPHNEYAPPSTTANPLWDLALRLPVLAERGPFERADVDMAFFRDEPHVAFPDHQVLKHAFSCVIPSPRVLRIISEISGVVHKRPIVMPCTRTGYWAWQLAQMGHEIHAYDTDEHARERVGIPWRFHQVRPMGAHITGAHRDAVLVLVWPPQDPDNQALRSLDSYPGDTVVYVGEAEGGATGCPQFHELLASRYEEIIRLDMTNFVGTRARLTIHRRRRGHK